MNDLEIFNFENNEVRTIVIENEPWFVGKDVADILGYANTRKALIDHIDEEDKDDVTIRDAIGRNQTMTAINESGLYSLILSSKMPNAKKFKRWVTSEVLPTIRKTGSYQVKELSKLEILEMAIESEKRNHTLSLENEQLLLNNKIQEQQMKEMKPKVTYYNVILNHKGLLTVKQIAKDYGMSAQKLNKILFENKVQYKESGQWFLYSKYQDKGYTMSKTFINTGRKEGAMDYVGQQTRWTQSGRLFIHQLLTSLGYKANVDKMNDEDHEN